MLSFSNFLKRMESKFQRRLSAMSLLSRACVFGTRPLPLTSLVSGILRAVALFLSAFKRVRILMWYYTRRLKCCEARIICIKPLLNTCDDNDFSEVVDGLRTVGDTGKPLLHSEHVPVNSIDAMERGVARATGRRLQRDLRRVDAAHV